MRWDPVESCRGYGPYCAGFNLNRAVLQNNSVDNINHCHVLQNEKGCGKHALILLQPSPDPSCLVALQSLSCRVIGTRGHVLDRPPSGNEMPLQGVEQLR